MLFQCLVRGPPEVLGSRGSPEKTCVSISFKSLFYMILKYGPDGLVYCLAFVCVLCASHLDPDVTRHKDIRTETGKTTTYKGKDAEKSKRVLTAEEHGATGN